MEILRSDGPFTYTEESFAIVCGYGTIKTNRQSAREQQPADQQSQDTVDSNPSIEEKTWNH